MPKIKFTHILRSNMKRLVKYNGIILYNPNVLILEELRLVEGVKVAVAVKTYPDGKVTGKIRCAYGYGIAEQVAGYFGGGGHEYAAGFRTYDTSYEEVLKDLVKIVPELLAGAEHA